uniref:MIP-T3_C domain-containing protein n=1 Tax=Angiostrongylus cantonensis TaxID=6313 RepID=A0A158P5Y4_ANGCA
IDVRKNQKRKRIEWKCWDPHSGYVDESFKITKIEKKTGLVSIKECQGKTLDGVGSRSVSSASALESDNVELINRLTSLQKTHADVNTLESENARLCREIEEKSEIIEHWIRKKPLKFGTGFESPRKSEGVLRKFISTTLTGDDASNDIKEMNKKLQRMLEETLSKNIILQRDLQTLLERTEL